MVSKLFSPTGRSPVGRALAVTAAAVVAAVVGTLLMQEGSAAVLILVGALGGAGLAKLAVELIRRCHDRGGSGGRVVLGLAGVLLAFVLALVAQIPTWLFGALAAVALTALTFVLLAPGDRQANRYGPRPPDGWRSAGVRPGGAALAIGLVMTVGGGGVGLALASLSEGLAERHAEHMQAAQATDAPDPLAGATPVSANEAARVLGNAR